MPFKVLWCYAVAAADTFSVCEGGGGSFLLSLCDTENEQ